MEDRNNISSPTPQLCTAGCGFYGSEHFLGLCSKCFAAKNKGTTTSTSPKPLGTETKSSNSTEKAGSDNDDTKLDDTHLLPRKHSRPSSILSEDHDQPSSAAPLSSPSTPSNSKPTMEPTAIIPNSTTPTTANTPEESKKPIQTNKGRCFKCRVKVPLAKQTINKCRCDYVFCDSHRFPERHDCEIDYAKIGRDILAKNNPKLRERPKGGTSFQRIDSL